MTRWKAWERRKLQIELVDVMEACTKTLAAQQEAQSANGFELEVTSFCLPSDLPNCFFRALIAVKADSWSFLATCLELELIYEKC